MKVHDFNGCLICLGEYEEHEYQAMLDHIDYQSELDTRDLFPEANCVSYEYV